MKWAKRHNLKAGEEIDLQETGNSLLINTSEAHKQKSTVLELKGADVPFIWRSVISAYRAGYDKITVHFKNPDEESKNPYTGFGYNNLQLLFWKGIVHLSPIEAIQALVNRLIGVEIIDQKETHCVIKEMGETSYKEFDNALRRIFLLLLSIASECYEGYAKNHKEPLRSINLIDTNIDRFEDFCLRVLNKRGYKENEKTPVMYTIIFLLELIGDEYKKLALHFLDLKTKPNQRMIREFEIQNKQLRRLYETFYNFSDKKVAEIYVEDGKGDKYLNDHYAKFSDQEKEIIHHFKKIGIYLLSLTELRIDLEA